MDRRAPHGDWTLYVYSRPPVEGWGRDLRTQQIELEEVGIFQSKNFKISFPYYQNKSKKVIVVKGSSYGGIHVVNFTRGLLT